MRGSRVATAAEAFRRTAHLGEVVWVGEPDGVDVSARSPAALARLLGGTHRAVVLDFHGGFDGDTLGRAHGLVPGGGVLVLRLPESSLPGRMGQWVETHLSRAPESPASVGELGDATCLAGTREQRALVTDLMQRLHSPEGTVTVVTAGRGRGKSAGLGLALRQLRRDRSVALVGPHRSAVAEVLRFSERADLQVSDPLSLLASLGVADPPDCIVVDEAARIPVPVLRALYLAAPHAHFVFATTTHGYEGSGRGFSLRFVPWLWSQWRPVHLHTLHAPIRWADHDPVERWVFDVLALDASPARGVMVNNGIRVERLKRSRMVEDPRVLREVFGLLVMAHYRTTPGDLRHLLDDPNVALHVAWSGRHVVGVGWLVADGGLAPGTIEAVERGQRLAGFALAESLICHAGHPEAAAMTMWRSVRTAVHPELRGKGIARQLIEHEHRLHHNADLIGTLFGATPELVAMRQHLGYQVVRLGVSRSARSGVPSVLMVHAQSARARAWVRTLRAELARDLPELLGRLNRERGVPLEPALSDLLHTELPAAAQWTDEALERAVRRYVEGSTPIDALAAAPRRWLGARPHWEEGLSPLERSAVASRVLANDPWHQVAQKCGVSRVPVAQRAVRRAFCRIWDTRQSP